ncbi:hypothetical protein MED15_01191 [Micromonospora noduli]|uniref:Uncharacterized protein n=1 Tax=Micromonospora noduli TaxID=709876 RepID=A0ABX9D8X0_9ACTN|nr:hypothetical protein [Micromonospora noduli]RAO23351.1 hypothetical protein MED15_01191 [Micromonospora noduli]
MTRTQLARVQTRRPAVVARRIVGTPTEVAATVALVRDSNRLLSMSEPRLLPGDSRVTVTVRFLDTNRPTPAPARRVNRGRVAAAVVLPAVGALAAVGYLAAQLVQAIRAAFPALAGVVLVLIVIALLLRRSGRCCPGLHCPGCGH